MQMTVGYKLTEIATGVEHRTWGGTWGQCPGIPNPLILPNGDHVHAPSINTGYSGFMLTEWMMEEPPPVVPDVITPRQCRIMLAHHGLLSKVEAAVSNMDEATRITWEYAIEFQRNDPLLLAVAEGLGLSSEQLDQMFIAAASL